MVKASAPGKVHLIGEHAVVYGEPAIIAAIGLRTIVKTKKSDKVSYKDPRWNHNDLFSLEDVKTATTKTIALWEKCSQKSDFLPLFQDVKANKHDNYKKSIVGIALRNLGIEDGVSIEIESDVLPGAGMGSSSSLHAAIVQALAAEFGKDVSMEEINDITFKMEQIIHGTPSGGDNSACCFGNMIWFQKSSPQNIVRPLGKEIPCKFENFVLVHTKPPVKNTGELVQSVRNLDENYRTPRVHEIGAMTGQMLDALKKKDFDKICSIINRTQKILKDLGVSVKEIDELASDVVETGGAAKLCGAGGGGIVLCYHKNKDKLLDVISSSGYKAIETDIGVEGVRIED